MTSYRELMDNALQAKQSREWSASNRAIELLGKELGMCASWDIPWDCDLATLTHPQLDQLIWNGLPLVGTRPKYRRPASGRCWKRAR